MNDFVEVGAIWDKEGKCSGQLNNGMRVFLSKNKYKEEGDNKPVYHLRMLTPDAEALGIADKIIKNRTEGDTSHYRGATQAMTPEEIAENIPF